ncbi:hypothetical protein [Streptomyces monomycini]|uniref:hypothetical protein n=1 Tax=Streptomyces monomycini TaxID=371720 RepID=UPI000AED435D|nr:hypothetical protein [Streptomyces monomycini]
MGRNKDYMTALLMARKGLSKEVAGLGRRLDDVRSEVALLRQEVADVRQLLAGSAKPAEVAEPEWADPDLADTGREPPFPPLVDDDVDDDVDGDMDDGVDDEDDVDGAETDVAAGAGAAGAGAFTEKIGAAPGRHETQEDVDHGVLLLKAAQAGSLALICHREVWEFLAVCAADEEHFRFAYELTDEGDGRVRAMLSGRSVIGALIALRRTRDASHLDGTWALASVFYSRIAESLRATVRDGKRPPAVHLDDGERDAAAGAATSTDS